MSSTTNLYHNPDKGCDGCPCHRSTVYDGTCVDHCIALKWFTDGVIVANDGFDRPGRLAVGAPRAPEDCPLREHGVLIVGVDR
jgi:hypothetical protein